MGVSMGRKMTYVCRGGTEGRRVDGVEKSTNQRWTNRGPAALSTSRWRKRAPEGRAAPAPWAPGGGESSPEPWELGLEEAACHRPPASPIHLSPRGEWLIHIPGQEANRHPHWASGSERSRAGSMGASEDLGYGSPPGTGARRPRGPTEAASSGRHQAQTRLRGEQGCQHKGRLIHQELRGQKGFLLPLRKVAS